MRLGVFGILRGIEIDRCLQKGIDEQGTFDQSACEICTRKIAATEVGSAQIRAPEIRVSEHGTVQLNPKQAGSTEIHVSEIFST